MTSTRSSLDCSISQSLHEALLQESKRTGESISHIVERALSNELDIAHHSLFQVSTSRALVEGVFGGCITVGDLKTHGDFGIGTFEQLDGELVMLDGHCFQISEGGVAHEVANEATVPFATLTRFTADTTKELKPVGSFEELVQQLDELKPSGNLFVGFRVEGTFDQLALRAACKAKPGEKLVAAIEHQSSYQLENLTGTLVGFCSPPYSAAISVPGYHFHFIDQDRQRGGHVFDIKAQGLVAHIHLESDIHLALPETREFLESDLGNDRSRELKSVETQDAE